MLLPFCTFVLSLHWPATSHAGPGSPACKMTVAQFPLLPADTICSKARIAKFAGLLNLSQEVTISRDQHCCACI